MSLWEKPAASPPVAQGGIIVMGGATQAGMPAFRTWVTTLAANPALLPTRRLVLLLDSDHAGKLARHAISDVLTNAVHAFLPLWGSRSIRASTYVVAAMDVLVVAYLRAHGRSFCASCNTCCASVYNCPLVCLYMCQAVQIHSQNARRHAVGNAGVEHANQIAILAALSTALHKPWDTPQQPWATQYTLERLELSTAFNEPDRKLVRCTSCGGCAPRVYSYGLVLMHLCMGGVIVW